MPTPASTLALLVAPWPDGGVEIDPVVDGVVLGEALDLDLAGVVVGSRDDVDRWRSDLLGAGSTWGRSGYAMVLMCACGVPEDDLLAVHVTVDEDVRWDDVQQQSRPPTTHRDAGPYRFERHAYEQEVDRACAEALRLLRPG